MRIGSKTIQFSLDVAIPLVDYIEYSISSHVLATIQKRRVLRSVFAQVRLLFESGVYSRAMSD